MTKASILPLLFHVNFLGVLKLFTCRLYILRHINTLFRSFCLLLVLCLLLLHTIDTNPAIRNGRICQMKLSYYFVYQGKKFRTSPTNFPRLPKKESRMCDAIE